MFRRRGSQEPFRGGVAIGDQVIDLAALAAFGRPLDQLNAASSTSPRPSGVALPSVWRAITASPLLASNSATIW